MDKKKMMNLTKKLVAGCLALSVIVAGIVVTPKAAEAEGEIVKGEITYKPMEMATYWDTNSKTAPVLADHIFAGWYTADANDEVTAIKEADGIPANTTTYAKFVPAYVLSVKTQVEAAAEVASTATKPESTFLRVLSSVDSEDYKNVGLEILLGDGEKVLEVAPITKVYEGLKLSETDTEVIRPNGVFGAAATYFTALNMEDISYKSFSSKIYIRPYWTTLDGTKVEGLAKNVRVEDKYSDYRYISVPVNLLTDGATPAEVAAGKVTMTYDATKFTVAKNDGNYRIDTGRLMSEMVYNVVESNGVGTITFVGNLNTINTNIAADGLYANIRFIRNEGYSEATESDLALTKTANDFCNWGEEKQEIIAW